MAAPSDSPNHIIVAAGPTVRIITPPAAAVIPVSLDDQLTADLRALHAREVEDTAAEGQEPPDFGQWLTNVLRDLVNGWLS